MSQETRDGSELDLNKPLIGPTEAERLAIATFYKDFNKARGPRTDGWLITDEQAAACIPEDGFIHDFVQMGMEATDAPTIYHVATALSCVCAAIGKAHYNTPGEQGQASETALRMWACLVGLSGDRKSTAMLFGQRLLQETLPHRLLPNDSTMEKWLNILAADPDGVKLIVWEELASLIESDMKSYSRGLKTFLVQSFSGGQLTRSTMTRDDRAERPRLSLLSAVPKESLGDLLTKEDWEKGFMARWNVFGGSRSRYNPHPTSLLTIPKQLKAAILQASTIKHIEIPYDTCSIIDKWAMKNIEGLNEEGTAPKEAREETLKAIAPSAARLRETAIVYAAIFECAKYRPKRVSQVIVEKDSVELALTVAYRQLLTLESLYYAYMCKVDDKNYINPIDSASNRVLRHIENQGISCPNWLLEAKICHRSSLFSVLNLLTETGELLSFKLVAGAGRPTNFYTTPKLANSPQVVELLNRIRVNLFAATAPRVTPQQGTSLIECLSGLKTDTKTVK